MTIVLFQVLGAFANRPFDESLNDSERDITVVDVSTHILCVCVHVSVKSMFLSYVVHSSSIVCVCVQW